MAEGDIFGIPSGLFGAGSSLLGMGGDLFAYYQEQQQRKSLKAIYDILQNPQKLNDYISRLYQPMSAGLNTAIQRDLGASWAPMTGGATGGALNQYIADALAKTETQRYQDTARNAIAALGGATATADRYKNQPGGNLGGIAKALQMLRQIRGTGGAPESGITVPVPGGVGFAGGSETWRDRADVFPSPVPQQDQYMTGGMS
jgi:hypothetical protein